MAVKSTEVLIVGGGIIGTSIAYYLVKKGVDVILCERNEIASGATGSNQSNCFIQGKMPGPLLELALMSKKNYQELAYELECDIEFDETTGLTIIENEDDLAFFNERIESQRKAGLNLFFIDRKELRKEVPYLSDHLIGAIACDQDFRINCINVTNGMAKKSRDLGAKILPSTEVVGIEMRNDKVRYIKTKVKSFEAKYIVIAAGCWSGEIGKMIGINIPVIPLTGEVVVTECLQRFKHRIIEEAAYFKDKVNSDDIRGKKSTISNTLKIASVFCQTKSGNCLIGSSRAFVGFRSKNTYDGISNIIKRAIRLIPVLKDICAIRCFSGLRPFTPDLLPILGNVKNINNLIIATGHEGSGISLGPASGKMIAELICEENISPLLDVFSFSRFDPSHPPGGTKLVSALH